MSLCTQKLICQNQHNKNRCINKYSSSKCEHTKSIIRWGAQIRRIWYHQGNRNWVPNLLMMRGAVNVFVCKRVNSSERPWVGRVCEKAKELVSKKTAWREISILLVCLLPTPQTLVLCAENKDEWVPLSLSRSIGISVPQIYITSGTSKPELVSLLEHPNELGVLFPSRRTGPFSSDYYYSPTTALAWMTLDGWTWGHHQVQLMQHFNVGSRSF